MEESFVACNWSYNVQKQYEPGDFDIFEKWVNTYVGNWASCDTLCNHTVGTFIEMYPEYLSGLKKWAKSPNRWAQGSFLTREERELRIFLGKVVFFIWEKGW